MGDAATKGFERAGAPIATDLSEIARLDAPLGAETRRAPEPGRGQARDLGPERATADIAIDPLAGGAAVADVYVSYASEDRDRALEIAAAFEAEGLKIWVDRPPTRGAPADQRSERAARTAKCVLVLWSAASRRSPRVRLEAAEAEARGALLAARIDASAPPLAHMWTPCEDLSEWRGDRADPDWRRTLLQARALAEKPEPFWSTSPYLRPALALPIRALIAATVAFAAVYLGVWIIAIATQAAALACAIIVAGVAFALFRRAEETLGPRGRALAERWLLPREAKLTLSAPEAALLLLQGVFGAKDVSLRTFARSAQATALAMAFTLLALWSILAERSPSFGEIYGDLAGIVVVMTTFLIANILGDYASLTQTRLLLRRASEKPAFTPALAMLDAALTAAIVGAIWIVVMFMFEFVISNPSTRYFARYMGAHVFYATVLSTYLASILFWCCAFLAPAARPALWSRRRGATYVGRLLAVQDRPFIALGYVSAAMILALGVAVWLYNQVYGF